MDFINAYLVELLGKKSLLVWTTSFTFVLIGVLISLRLAAYKRDKASNNTPTVFNWKFLFRDNIIRTLGSIFVTFAIIRFGEEFTGRELSYFWCLILGLCFDQVLVFVESWQRKGRDIFKEK